MAKRIIKDELTAERLRELLDYSPHTGEFVWRVSCRGTKELAAVAYENEKNKT